MFTSAEVQKLYTKFLVSPHQHQRAYIYNNWGLNIIFRGLELSEWLAL